MNLDSTILENYLLCDASQTLISNGSLEEELLLYNINPDDADTLFSEYQTLTGKDLNPRSNPDELSGGQKVLLMALLALHSPAQSILFVDIHTALDTDNRQQLDELIRRYSPGRKILVEKSQ